MFFVVEPVNDGICRVAALVTQSSADNGRETPAVSLCASPHQDQYSVFHFIVLTFYLSSCSSLLLILNSCFLLMPFHRPTTAVNALFSQVEVGDVIRVNGRDFVPADAVILSSRYRSPPCCQAVGNFSSFSFLLLLLLALSQLSLKR